MKWYKRDPDAYFAGTRCLTLEERGAYNDVIELLYSRNGDLPDDDRMIARNLVVRPQVWRRIKARLIVLGKLHQTQGKLTANRIETTLKEAENFNETQRKRAERGWVSRKKCNENNDGEMPPGNANTTTTTTTATIKKEKKEAPNGGASRPPSFEADLFRRGREVLGGKSGGLIAKLLKIKKRDVAVAMAVIEDASAADNPREYVGRVVAGARHDSSEPDYTHGFASFADNSRWR